LSSALEALHRSGLVHRDIKPSNIIFVGGVPKLADIGLVADLSEARSFVGTDGFIPPEGPGKPSADIYALGKVLYEASTGLDRMHFPSLPENFEGAADGEMFWELNEVILQACQNEPAARYETAAKMHEELLFLTSGKSVKRLRQLEKRFARMKRSGALAGAILLTAAAIAFPIYREWKHNLELRQQKVGANIADGNRAMNSGDLLGALPYFVEAFELDIKNKAQETNHRYRIASVLAQSPKLTHAWSYPEQVNACSFSPDDQYLLVTAPGREAWLYNLRTDEKVDWKIAPPSITRTTFSPNGRYLLSSDDGGHARVWEMSTHREISTLTHRSAVSCAEFSPDGTRVAAVCRDGWVYVWDWRATNALLRFEASIADLRAVAYSPDGKEIITGGRAGRGQIWNAETGKLIQGPLFHPNVISSATFSTDGRRVIIGCQDFKVRVWDVATGQMIRPELSHRDLVTSVQASADGRFILTASLDGTARIWRADTQQEVAMNSIFHHPDRVMDAAFSQDCRQVATVCFDGSIRIWDLALENQPRHIDQVSFSANGSKCLLRQDNDLELVDSASWKSASGKFSAKGRIERWGLNRDGSIAYALSSLTNGEQQAKHLVQFWRPVTAVSPAGELEFTNRTRGVTINADGSLMIAWGTNWVELCDLSSGKRHSLGYSRKVRFAVFSAGLDTFAISAGTNLDVFHMESEPRLMCRLPHIRPIYFAQFSPDTSLIASACADPGFTKCYAQVWETKTGKPVGPRLNHSDGVLTAVFSPDGQRVVTTSEDFTSVVWDFRSGKPVASSMDHDKQVHQAVFSSNGKYLATVGADCVARVWDVNSGMALTPRIHFPVLDLVEVYFCQGDRTLVVVDNGTRDAEQDDRKAWSFSITDEKRSVTDIARLSSVLSSVTPASAEHMRAQAKPDFAQQWAAMKKAYPIQFKVTDAEINEWHRMQAEICDSEGDMTGSVFHWQILVRTNSGDPQLLTNLKAARDHMHRLRPAH
jgi:WD40 repeat protein